MYRLLPQHSALSIADLFSRQPFKRSTKNTLQFILITFYRDSAWKDAIINQTHNHFHPVQCFRVFHVLWMLCVLLKLLSQIKLSSCWRFLTWPYKLSLHLSYMTVDFEVRMKTVCRCDLTFFAYHFKFAT